MNGITATVATAAGGVNSAGGFVHITPGWLFTSSLEAVIVLTLKTEIFASK